MWSFAGARTLVVAIGGLILYLASSALGQYECTENGHRVLSDPFRSEEFVAASSNELLCDKTLDRGWYRFEIFGKNAEMPTRCVQVNHCGTSAPIWLNTEGQSLPSPGQTRRFSGCVTWQMNQLVADHSCCFFSFPVTVTNCENFFVYYLAPARGCYMAYCATEARQKCGTGEISPDGFAPCRKSFPAIMGLPRVQPVVFLDSVQLQCSFTIMDSSNDTSKVYSVTWYKADRGSAMFRYVQSEDTVTSSVSIDLNQFRMGEKVLCTVQAFYNNTRELMSPPIESDQFNITIQVSPTRLNVSEDGERYLILFESSIPLRCPPSNPQCQIRIPLSVITDEDTPDITLSDCAVTFIPQTCARSEERCRQTFVNILAMTDFITDNNRVSQITTGPILSPDPFWNGFDPDDIEVTVNDVPGGYCFSFTDPHFITFDKKKYSFFKTGTFVMFRSNRREFEVHSRFWECSNSVYPVSCNCGFVVREDNDVIAVDMCRGEAYNSDLDVQILSGQPLTEGIKILEAKDGKKITIVFPSGAYVRADIADWGMSISLRVPSSEFGRTAGLCGTFDGNPQNDFHDNHDTMTMEPGMREPVDFVERWRLRDGGMFKTLPSSNPFDFRLPACSCQREDTESLSQSEEVFLSNIICPQGNCDISCDTYEYFHSQPLIRSKDVTKFYIGSLQDFGPLSFEDANDFVVNQSPPPEDVFPVANIDPEQTLLGSFPTDVVAGNSHIQKKINLNLRNQQRLEGQLDDIEVSAITDFLTILNLDFPLFQVAPESSASNLIDTYSFPPDERDLDLLPLTPKWPTTSGITQTQARDICEQTLRYSPLGRLCGEEGIGSDEYVLDAVELCMSDIQLTDDPTWRFETIPLLENLCEAAMEDKRYLVGEKLELERMFNCPNNCSGKGVCGSYGCECDSGHEEIDCSKVKDVPVLQRIEKNGLCDNRNNPCDHINLNIKGLDKLASVECIFSNPRTWQANKEESHVNIRVPGQVINRRTIRCSLGELENNIDRPVETFSFRQWDVQVAQDGHLSRENLTLTFYDSACISCDWTQECHILNNTCLINGLCYASRDEHPSEVCLLCLPWMNNEDWSKSSENLPPLVNIPRNTLYSLVRQPVQLQLEGFDPEGQPLTYTVHTRAASVTNEGLFSWESDSSGYFQIPVLVSDVCGEEIEFHINIEVIECLCQNGGSCLLDPLTGPPYICICPIHYSGLLCEDYALSCSNLVCEHGACLADSYGQETCQCNTGYTGVTCSTVVDPCESNPCYPGVHCFTINSRSFICGTCPRGLIGNGQLCRNAVCASCPRNAVCNDVNGCVCPYGTSGQGCLTSMCNPPCQNNGRCVRPNVCQCQPGFKGPTCAQANCGLQCENGGYCVGLQRCQCKPGYTGTTCAIPICSPHCRNGGICVKPGTCSCPRGFHGSNCQHAICSHSCLNGGTCVRHNMCSCQTGFSGRHCQTPTCEPRCMNNGRCVAPNKCSCSSGYKGKKCNKAICVSPCRNGGVCVNPNVCACKSGFTGSTCQTAVCNRPCMYGGKCIARDRCQCRSGRRGRYCEKPNRKRNTQRT
ncbi:von Willebrand factor D and EGF domain-containing protein-like isoform X2 [Apostichopus japonicus]|uniref:von Willebrand factor D and EGF domain-containing protein-like isoform X2 n=1 Tax=Stichopus japonicus TaxID=307972 RepID=UPI003AB25EB4